MKQIGYDRPLFVQPFDHRGSFTKGFFGIAGAPVIEPGSDQRTPVSQAKALVYRGLLRAIEMGVPRESLGLLVDAEFGGHVLLDAKRRGIPVAVCVEKSGQNVFDFEYGPRWQDHLRFFSPDMVKCLVRYHPADDPGANREQLARLKELSDYIHAGNDHYFMFELLVPALTADEKAMGERYDKELRPQRMIEAMAEIQDFGVEPDIWKIEGLENREQAVAVAAQARRGEHRSKVGCILLGRGSNATQVHHWLRVAAPVDGYIGFAVGRTIFSEPLKGYLADPTTEAAAVQTIADNYKACVDVWRSAAG